MGREIRYICSAPTSQITVGVRCTNTDMLRLFSKQSLFIVKIIRNTYIGLHCAGQAHCFVEQQMVHIITNEF